MKIKIKNTQRKVTINKKKIVRLAKQVLKIKGIRQAELSILFVGNKRMRKLNKKFRKIDRPADVLAFSMHEGRNSNLHPEILGDVVIYPEIAQKFAPIYNTTEEREVCLYLIHGILHLLGYLDESPGQRSIMEKEQTRIFKRLLR